MRGSRAAREAALDDATPAGRQLRMMIAYERGQVEKLKRALALAKDAGAKAKLGAELSLHEQILARRLAELSEARELAEAERQA